MVCVWVVWFALQTWFSASLSSLSKVISSEKIWSWELHVINFPGGAEPRPGVMADSGGKLRPGHQIVRSYHQLYGGRTVSEKYCSFYLSLGTVLCAGELLSCSDSCVIRCIHWAATDWRTASRKAVNTNSAVLYNQPPAGVLWAPPPHSCCCPRYES